MKLSVNELKLITLISISGPNGEPIKIGTLNQFFERPCFLEKARDSLRRWSLIAYDPFQDVGRLLRANVIKSLSCGPCAQQEMITSERPLDAVLAEVLAANETLGSPVLNSHAESRVPARPINVTSTFNRKDVSTIKRNTLTCDQLQSAVAEFVGDDDFEIHWARSKFWNDPTRAKILEGSLRFLRNGIKSKEIHTKTTPGKHLWNQFRHDCRAKGIEALV
jgi:hypothetical protein